MAGAPWCGALEEVQLPSPIDMKKTCVTTRRNWTRWPATAIRFAGSSLAFGLLVLSGTGHSTAALAHDWTAAGIGGGLRLVMVDDIGCVWCRKWDAEVAPIYQESPAGRVAPLERRPKRHGDLAPYEPLTYTPTFVLVRDGAEIGRIVGYAGADFFWAEFEKLVAKDAARQPPGKADPRSERQRDARLQ